MLFVLSSYLTDLISFHSVSTRKHIKPLRIDFRALICFYLISSFNQVLADTKNKELAHVIQLLKHKKITPLAFQQGAYFLFNSSLFINLVFFLPIRFYVLFYKKSIPLC